jgi:hypothetical protein
MTIYDILGKWFGYRNKILLKKFVVRFFNVINVKN